jgi:hypothetical protein
MYIETYIYIYTIILTSLIKQPPPHYLQAICVYLYVYTYITVYAYVYIYIFIYICIYIYTCIYIYIYIYIYIRIYLFIYLSIRIYNQEFQPDVACMVCGPGALAESVSSICYKVRVHIIIICILLFYFCHFYSVVIS